MSDISKSSSSGGSPSEPNSSGNGVSGGESGFHQQMHQQFAYRGKFQTPPALRQQRPVMVPYKQFAVPQQQGPYAAQHVPYQQHPHQQQQLPQHQQQNQQQQNLQQQLHQLYQHQMQFTQPPEFVQHTMAYIQDTEKSSINPSQQNLKTSDVEKQNRDSSVSPTTAAETPDRELSVRPVTAAVKIDDATDIGSEKEANQTPAEKELEAVRAAYEKQVKELQEQVKALQEQKSQKEVKYLRVPKQRPSKKTTVDISQEEEMDTSEDHVLEGEVFDSCPSPAASEHSVVSIKQEEPEENWTIQGSIYQETDEEDNKANIDKEVSKYGPEDKSQNTFTLSVTDFDFCIYCQTKSEMKMSHVTEDNIATVKSIVLNVDCEASKRLKDYVLDTEMFFDNLPQFHYKCYHKMQCKLRRIRKNRKNLQETDFSLCIFCQEHLSEPLSNFTNKGFASFQQDLNKLNDEMIEKLNKCFNFNRVKLLVKVVESSKEDFSPDKFKNHKCCRTKFRIKSRRIKIQKTLTAESENMEDNVKITPAEDIFILLSKRRKKLEEIKQRKERNVLPEPSEFIYKKKCVICGIREGGRKGKFRSLTNTNIQKTRDNADKNKHSDIIKILKHGLNLHKDLLCHYKCFGSYNYNNDKVKKGTLEFHEMAFTAIITEIEDPMFRNGKVFSLEELREKYLKSLLELNIESNQKMSPFVQKIKKYYTFKSKCRVTVLSYPDWFIYSNHLSESQVSSQINEFKKAQVTEDMADSNTDSLFINNSNEDSKNIRIKKEWRFSCNECDFKCYKKIAYKHHLKTHDSRSIEEILKSTQVMCDICGKTVKNKAGLKAHKNTHSGEKYPCLQCGKIYYSKYALIDHTLIHTGEKNMLCPDCGMKYYTKKQLFNHVNKIHRSSGQLFLCSVCGHSFKTKDLLKEHSNKHSGNRPFICKVCGKAFKFRSNLRTHLLAHDGKKPQMCSICSFGCATRITLNLHMATHT